MSTTEHRRSARIVKRVPLHILSDDGTQEAYSAVINGHGALVVAPVAYPDEAVVHVENRRAGTQVDARVVWSGGEDEGTGFKIGLEFLDDVDFWGTDYAPEETEEGRVRLG